jgi:orotidine-5'-phosphate decarboxylase
MTPKEAITNGADYLVIGRPITADKNPREVTRRILEEITR